MNDLLDQVWCFEGLFVQDHVDEGDIKEDEVVHGSEDRMTREVGNCCVAANDAHADREKFECEYEIPIDDVQGCDVELQTAEGFVVLFNYVGCP